MPKVEGKMGNCGNRWVGASCSVQNMEVKGPYGSFRLHGTGAGNGTRTTPHGDREGSGTGDQGPMGLHTHFAAPSPVPGPVPVQCV